MREVQVRGNERNARTVKNRRAVQGREIREFGNRHRELCAQDFLAPEALRCFEKSNKKPK